MLTEVHVWLHKPASKPSIQSQSSFDPTPSTVVCGLSRLIVAERCQHDNSADTSGMRPIARIRVSPQYLEGEGEGASAVLPESEGRDISKSSSESPEWW